MKSYSWEVSLLSTFGRPNLPQTAARKPDKHVSVSHQCRNRKRELGLPAAYNPTRQRHQVVQLPAAYNLTPTAAYYFTRQTRQVVQLPAAYNLTPAAAYYFTRQTRQVVQLPATPKPYTCCSLLLYTTDTSGFCSCLHPITLHDRHVRWCSCLQSITLNLLQPINLHDRHVRFLQLPAAYNLTRETRQVLQLPAAYNLTPQKRQAVQLSVVLVGVTQQLNEQKVHAGDVLARYLIVAFGGGTRP